MAFILPRIFRTYMFTTRCVNIVLPIVGHSNKQVNKLRIIAMLSYFTNRLPFSLLYFAISLLQKMIQIFRFSSSKKFTSWGFEKELAWLSSNSHQVFVQSSTIKCIEQTWNIEIILWHFHLSYISDLDLSIRTFAKIPHHQCTIE